MDVATGRRKLSQKTFLNDFPFAFYFPLKAPSDKEKAKLPLNPASQKRESSRRGDFLEISNFLNRMDAKERERGREEEEEERKGFRNSLQSGTRRPKEEVESLGLISKVQSGTLSKF